MNLFIASIWFHHILDVKLELCPKRLACSQLAILGKAHSTELNEGSAIDCNCPNPYFGV